MLLSLFSCFFRLVDSRDSTLSCRCCHKQVEGLQSCEFLNKLDLTVNFVDMDELENSVSAMERNRHLKDLYMMGNPCQVGG